MKESELRAIIREHVKKTLKEAGPRLGAGQAELERGLGKISGRASRLTKRQKMKAVLPVLQKFGISAGDLPMIKAALTKMSAPEPKPEPEVEENYTAGVDDGDAGKSIAESSLDAKADKLDKSQAWQMLQKAVQSKPASQQAEFIVDLVGRFNLDDSVKRKLKMQIKNMK